MTDRYAVIGNPIAHSKSPLIHAEFARQTAQDMCYEALLAPLDGFGATVAGFRSQGGKGVNVTLPFKLEALQIANRLTPRAEAAGAVNTLCFENAEVLGDNTDGIGLVLDLRERLRFSLRGKRILILGAGGAARGVILPLLEEQPACLALANRTLDRALALQRRFAAHAPIDVGPLESFAGGGFDLVINATSTGLDATRLSLPAGLFAPEAMAYDMVYGKPTNFLLDASSIGVARIADGLGMLVGQAAEAFRLWRGVRPDPGPVYARVRA